jgi:8-oxo-dGTP pyrophosphatase MutT (NUDIX family)
MDFSTKYLAPNGQPSNLTPEQWRLVRSPEFKAWFGDWENEPEKSSKVVDENGEPLVCEHRSNNAFNVFDVNKIGTKTDTGYFGKGFYFAPKAKASQVYGALVNYFFLNLKNPIYKKSYEVDPRNNQGAIILLGDFDFSSNKMRSKKESNEIQEIVVFESNQIKLADGTNTTFDGTNPDIRFEDGGTFESKQKQLEIINRSNPAPNEYNTWIRKVDDIKTAEQVFSIAFEDGAMYPDFQTDDMTKALDSGYVTVFSSYPIKEGVFVTPSKMNALDYAGGKGGKVFSKTVELKDIAWIDESEGQYAPTELFAKGGTTEYLLAPNGQPSNLTPEQWRLVRSSEFKRWFGDWENDPENSSKVVDENGEPLVVSHGTKYTDKYYNFDLDTIDESRVKAFFFSSGYEHAKRYTYGVGYIREFFINIRRLFDPKSLSEQDIKSVLPILNENLVVELNNYNDDNSFFDELKKQYGINETSNNLALFHVLTKTTSSWQIIEQPSFQNYLIEKGYEGFKTSEQSTLIKKDNENFAVYSPQNIKLADGTNTTFDVANPDIRFANGGTTEFLLAPNGQPSNLTPEQWRLVRSPEFKAWFGDWENAPENSSKIVDENGEPLVCYHGTNNEFNQFDIDKIGYSTDSGMYGKGFYFSNKIEYAIEYANRKGQKGFLMRCFLNIKKPLEIKTKFDIPTMPQPQTIEEMKIADKLYSNNFRNFLINKRYDGVIISLGYTERNKEFVVLQPEQIKLADGTNTTFDGANPDIRFKKGGRTISQTPSPTKDRIYGSQVNPKKSSSNLSSALKIEFSAQSMKTIKDKVEKHNAEYPNKQITVESAKAVVRRGMGAYSNSHRPTISGGKPNSRFAWGLARLNAFIYKILNGKSKSGKYKQDDDLISELGYKVSRFDNGGKTDIPTRFFGSQAGGVLIYCKTTNRVLLLLRSPFVLEPFTWSTVSGKVEGDEQIEETVRRETYEETGYQLKTLHPSYVFVRPNFKFFNFISIVEQEFEPQLDWENIDYLWTSLDNLPENLHFGLVELLKHGKIEETVKQITARFKKRG